MTLDLGSKIQRDRWGRPLLPDPDTGQVRPWTRPSTLSSTLSDKFGLQQWAERMVAKGIGMRRDLYALAAAVEIADKDTLNRVAKDAKEAAAASAGANMGTALHSFTEQIDRGETVDAPEPWDRDLDAYRRLLATQEITAYGDWIERMTVTADVGCAGTYDRIYRWQDRWLIGDVKTAKNVEYGWLEIAIQLAIYANASHMWNAEAAAWEVMPEVDKDIAVVVHLPAGRAEATLWEIDIAAGWEAAQVCCEVREWRTRKNLARAAGSVIDPYVKLHAAHETSNIDLLIETAKTVERLTEIWQNAVAQGAWGTNHTHLAAQRKAKLLEGK